MCAYMTLRIESTAAYHVNGNNLFIQRQIRASAVSFRGQRRCAGNRNKKRQRFYEAKCGSPDDNSLRFNKTV